jgi:hypothetical protein
MTPQRHEDLCRMGKLKHLRLNQPSFQSRCDEQQLTEYISLRSIAWNPLGTLIATGSADRTLRV